MKSALDRSPAGGPTVGADLRAPVCPVCGGARYAPEPSAPTARGYSVGRCADCGLGVTLPPPDPADIPDFYPASHYGSGGPRYRPLVERIAIWFRRRRAAWIARLLPPGTALEVGCGHGYLLAGLRDRAWTVEGVELHDASAAYGRSILGLPIRIGEFAALRFPTAAFDVVIFWHSFEHMRDPAGCLREAARVLKPDGVVIVAVPNAKSWQARWAGPSWFHWEIPRHLYHFDVATLSALVERAGFTIVGVSHANWEQNPFGWTQSFFNRLGFAPNGLFSSLWAASSVPRGATARIAERLLAVPALAAGFALAAVETACRRGGTVTIVARRSRGG